jgi:hypothetical protein
MTVMWKKQYSELCKMNLLKEKNSCQLKNNNKPLWLMLVGTIINGYIHP